MLRCLYLVKAILMYHHNGGCLKDKRTNAVLKAPFDHSINTFKSLKVITQHV